MATVPLHWVSVLFGSVWLQLCLVWVGFDSVSLGPDLVLLEPDLVLYRCYFPLWLVIRERRIQGLGRQHALGPHL